MNIQNDNRSLVVLLVIAAFSGVVTAMLVVTHRADPCFDSNRCVAVTGAGSEQPLIQGATSLVCGDGVCTSGENETQCPDDCATGKIKVASASSVVIYEQTGSVSKYEFYIHSITESPAKFMTDGGETYSISTDGENLVIACHSNRNRSGLAVGGNLVAVKLKGVAGYPGGVWASNIAGYTLGANGIADSMVNILGDDSIIGPYKDSFCTYLGNGDSRITVAFRAGEAARCGDQICASDENSYDCPQGCPRVYDSDENGWK